MGALVGKDTGPNSLGQIVPDSTSPLYGLTEGGGGAFSVPGLVPAAVAAVLGSKISSQQQLDTLDDATAALPPGSCGNMTQGYLKEIQGDKNRHCYWGNPDLTPGDFPAPPVSDQRQGAGGYGGYGGGYGGSAGSGGYGYGSGAANPSYSGGAAYGATGAAPHGLAGQPFSSAGETKKWHGQSGQRWKAGAPPQKRSVGYVLPETAITGDPEHIEPINPYPPVPSPKEEANSAAAKFLFGTAGMAIGAANYLI
eukprot:symbB.v1.2.039630.t1/scaffold6694.1/size16127/2